MSSNGSALSCGHAAATIPPTGRQRRPYPGPRAAGQGADAAMECGIENLFEDALPSSCQRKELRILAESRGVGKFWEGFEQSVPVVHLALISARCPLSPNGSHGIL